MHSEAPLVSVITPFYNTEEYLAECIESVLKQTFGNWEYVLLNNCSTDRSVEIAEHYAKLHPGKIRLEHNNEFLPQLANYNQALRYVTPGSKYCKMVLADDWMFPKCLELMVEAAERDPSIGAVGAYSIEGRWVAFDGLPYPSPVSAGKDICRRFFLENVYVFGSPTQLLLRSDLVRNRTPFYYDAYVPFADAAVMFDALKDWKFGFVHEILTFSRRDNASIMQSLLEIDSQFAFWLFMLHEFGASYLDPAEYQKELKFRERAYAQLLVDGMFGNRGSRFWEFHKRMLKRMGYTFRSARVWWLFFLGTCEVVFNPKRGFRLVYDGLRATKQ